MKQELFNYPVKNGEKQRTNNRNYGCCDDVTLREYVVKNCWKYITVDYCTPLPSDTKQYNLLNH